MSLNAKEKIKLIKKHGVHEKDTGSAEVQVALFSEEIKRLTKHLEKHKKDNSSRRGILKMVSKRKRLLDFLKKEDPRRYSKLIRKLELKK